MTAMFSFLTCIWQGVTNSWPHLFVARFVLGLGIGPKSATVPVYSAECVAVAASIVYLSSHILSLLGAHHRSFVVPSL